MQVAAERAAFDDGHESTIGHLTREKLRAHRFAFPPAADQSAIVRFLDHADRRIRRYIRAKEKLIALLEEQTQAIVQQAVTGQIDVRTGRPYPAYKPSDAAWIGDVPEHWDVRQLRSIGHFFKGRGGSKEDESENGVSCVRYGDLYTRHQFFITESKALVMPQAAEGAYTPIRYGDILFAGSGETIDEIGKSAVNLMLDAACCGGDVIILRPTIDINARFLGYLADCPYVAYRKACNGRGITVMHVYSSDIKHITVALPPVDEQAAIASFLDQATTVREAAHQRTQREIDLVRDYRTRLIADVVTGRVDVWETVANLPQVDPLATCDDADDGTGPRRSAIRSAS